jgi:hypothetical protein
MDRFTELLAELGDLLDTDLRPDVRGHCKINLNDQWNVQLEFQPERERILIASFLCDVPPGKLRENILKDGLKANWPTPKGGTLCYSERNNKLCLFEYVSTEQLSGKALASTLDAFIAQGEKWRAAVETGRTSDLVPSPKKSQGNIFGMK